MIQRKPALSAAWRVGYDFAEDTLIAWSQADRAMKATRAWALGDTSFDRIFAANPVPEDGR